MELCHVLDVYGTTKRTGKRLTRTQEPEGERFRKTGWQGCMLLSQQACEMGPQMALNLAKWPFLFFRRVVSGLDPTYPMGNEPAMMVVSTHPFKQAAPDVIEPKGSLISFHKLVVELIKKVQQDSKGVAWWRITVARSALCAVFVSTPLSSEDLSRGSSTPDRSHQCYLCFLCRKHLGPE